MPWLSNRHGRPRLWIGHYKTANMYIFKLTVAKVLAQSFMIIYGCILWYDSQGLKLFVQRQFRQCSLHDICSVQIVHAISPHYALLFLGGYVLRCVILKVSSKNGSISGAVNRAILLEPTLVLLNYPLVCPIASWCDPSACVCIRCENQSVHIESQVSSTEGAVSFKYIWKIEYTPVLYIAQKHPWRVSRTPFD